MTEQRPTTCAGLEGSAATTPERRDGAVVLDRTAFAQEAAGRPSTAAPGREDRQHG